MNNEVDVVDLQRDLLPERTRPLPLPVDFDKIIVERNPPKGTKPSDLFVLSAPRLHEASVLQAAEEIVGMNEAAIDEASRRIAASSLPVPNGPIYHDLIPTTFDESELIAKAEANLEKQRQAAPFSMIPIVLLFLFSPSLGSVPPSATEYIQTTKYIELSMDLITMFKDVPEFNEQEIHDLAKTCVNYGENQRHLMKAYEAYLHNKSGEYQRLFTEKFIIPRHISVVEKKLQNLPGFYMTKTQIEKFRAVLLENKLTGISAAETIASLKAELSKEIGEHSADRAIEMLVKDLKIIYKVHGNMVQQVDPALAYLVHDEL